jgi:hypothetical protein
MKEQSSIKIKTNQLKFESFDNDENFQDVDSFNKENLLQIIKGISELSDLHKIKKQVIKLENWLLNQKENIFEKIGSGERNEAISFRKDTLISELEQILKSQTFERAKYYLTNRKSKINEVPKLISADFFYMQNVM